MIDIIDGAGILLGLLMIYGAWYVFKLSKLSNAWRAIWVYFALFMFCLPGSRIVVQIVYATCPDTLGLELIVKVILPLLGGVCFILYCRKLYHLFSKYLGNDRPSQKEREKRDTYRDVGRDEMRDTIRDVARDKEKDNGGNK